MPTYTAIIRTFDNRTAIEIDAATPEQALQQARILFDASGEALDWCEYRVGCLSLEEIDVEGPDGEAACWQSDDLRMRLAAPDLLAALEAVIDREDAASVFATAILAQARAAVAKAKTGS